MRFATRPWAVRWGTWRWKQSPPWSKDGRACGSLGERSGRLGSRGRAATTCHRGRGSVIGGQTGRWPSASRAWGQNPGELGTLPIRLGTGDDYRLRGQTRSEDQGCGWASASARRGATFDGGSISHGSWNLCNQRQEATSDPTLRSKAWSPEGISPGCHARPGATCAAIAPTLQRYFFGPLPVGD